MLFLWKYGTIYIYTFIKRVESEVWNQSNKIILGTVQSCRTAWFNYSAVRDLFKVIYRIPNLSSQTMLMWFGSKVFIILTCHIESSSCAVCLFKDNILLDNSSTQSSECKYIQKQTKTWYIHLLLNLKILSKLNLVW